MTINPSRGKTAYQLPAAQTRNLQKYTSNLFLSNRHASPHLYCLNCSDNHHLWITTPTTEVPFTPPILAQNDLPETPLSLHPRASSGDTLTTNKASWDVIPSPHPQPGSQNLHTQWHSISNDPVALVLLGQHPAYFSATVSSHSTFMLSMYCAHARWVILSSVQ